MGILYSAQVFWRNERDDDDSQSDSFITLICLFHETMLKTREEKQDCKHSEIDRLSKRDS